ncbi:MAG: endonuclease/exonuclease/phosphatase family protein [Planctomycetota bacterium]
MSENDRGQDEGVKRYAKRWTFWLIGVVTLILVVLTAMGLTASWWWPGQVAEYLRPHTAAVLAVTALVSFVCKRWGWAGLCVGVLFVNMATLALLAPETARVLGQSDIRVMHLNLDRNNDQVQLMIDAILNPADGRQADILCLQEFTSDWDNSLKQHLKDYEWIESIPRDDSRGVAMLYRQGSPLSVTGSQVLQWLPSETDRPTLAVDFVVNQDTSRRLTLLSLHTKRPSSPSKSREQQREFEAAASWCVDHLAMINMTKDLLVIGDFNATPWALNYRRFVEDAGLGHVGSVLRSPATYPSRWTRPLRVPIDLAAVSPGVATERCFAGPYTGSDHRPLIVDILVYYPELSYPN